MGLIAITLVAFYTVTYGLWAWRKNMRRGTIGLFILALLNLAAPLSVWLYHRLQR